MGRQPASQRRSVEHTEFHWLVGILEGEGTFQHGPPSTLSSPVVRVVMTDEDIVARVARFLARSVQRISPRRDGYKTAFAVSVKGIDAVRLMVSARAELGNARRAQIDYVLADWGLTRTRWPYRGARCAVDGCDAPVRTQGLCKAHFNRWYKAKRRGADVGYERKAIARDEILREPVSHDPAAECELAWLAGLLEGEGCFSHSGGYPSLSLQMCSRDVVERAASLLATTSVKERQPRDPAWNNTYVAALRGAAAAMWMQRLRPLMGERRRKAIDAAIDAYYPVRLSVAPEHCVVPGCDAPPRGRGLCHKHYMSWSRDRAKGREPRVKPLRSN